MVSKSRPGGERPPGQEPSHTRADGAAQATDCPPLHKECGTRQGRGRCAEKVVATYVYTDEEGRRLFGVQRCVLKHFRQFRFLDPDGDDTLIAWKLNGVRRVLYRLPLVVAAVNEGEAVYIVEGEKDAHAAERAGAYVATCNPGGADKWRDEYAKHLQGAQVIVIPDADGGTGDRHAADIVKSLTGVAADIRVARPREGKDVSDHLAAGLGLNDLKFVDPKELLPSSTATETGTPIAPGIAAGTDVAAKLLGMALTKVNDGEGRNASGFWLATQLRDHGVVQKDALVWMTSFVQAVPGTNTAGEEEPYTLEDAEASLDQAYSEERREGFLVGDATDDKVAEALAKLRVHDRARELLREEKAAASWALPPSRGTLADELAIPDPPMPWTVADLHPTGANTLLSASYKTGKTTLLLNLFSSLLTGEPFLGAYQTATPTGRVAFWNYELSDRQFREWLRAFDLPAEVQSRAAVWNLRGWTLPLSSDYIADQAVRWLAEREVSKLFVDPFAMAFDGDNENDNTQVGRWLERLDVIKQRAGVEDLFLATHFGRGQEGSAERTRGATRLDDWADARWTYVKDDHDRRYLRADGRDVLVPESEVLHDATTRRLRLIGGSRREAKQEVHVHSVVASVADEPGILTTALRDRVSGRKEDRPNHLAEAIRRGYVRVDAGEKGARRHYVTDDGKEYLAGRMKVTR